MNKPKFTFTHEMFLFIVLDALGIFLTQMTGNIMYQTMGLAIGGLLFIIFPTWPERASHGNVKSLKAASRFSGATIIFFAVSSLF